MPSGRTRTRGRPPEAPIEPDASLLNAARVGTWRLDIEAKTLSWSRQTATIFGLVRTFSAPYDTFLERVCPEHREAVAFRMSDAIDKQGGTFLRFRMRRQDGALREVISTAQASKDGPGGALQMVGVVFDITDRRMFSTREAAQLLGVSEASLKRLTDSGMLRCVRVDKRGSRHIAPDDLLAHLGQEDVSVGQLAALDEMTEVFAGVVRAGNLAAALALLVQLSDRGHPLENLLDTLVAPLLGRPEEQLLVPLLDRIPALGPHPQDGAKSILVIPVAPPDAGALGMVRCMIRSRGFEVLTSSGGLTVEPLAQLAIRARVLACAFIFPGALADPALEQSAMKVASELGGLLPRDSICAVGLHLLGLPEGVAGVRSMGELAKILDRR